MRVLRYIAMLATALVTLALLLAIGGYLYLASEAGRGFIARKGSELASSDAQQITLSAITGRLSSDVTIGHISLADAKGVWLEIEGLRVRYTASKLIRRQPPLQEVEAERITLHRQPEPSGDKASGGGTPDLDALAAYLPARMQVGEVWIKEPVAGHEQRLGIEGGGDASAYRLQVHTLQGVETALDATIKPSARDFALLLRFREAPGGIVGALAGLPNTIPLAADADLQADLEGDMTLRHATLVAGSAGLEASGNVEATTGKVALQGRIALTDMQVSQALAQMPMSGSAEVKLRIDGTMEALHVALSTHSPHMAFDGQRIDALVLTAEGDLNPAAWGTDAFRVAGTLDGSMQHNGTLASLAGTLSVAGGILETPALNARYGEMEASGKLTAKGTLQTFDLISDMALKSPYGASDIQLHGKVDTEAARYNGEVKGRFSYEAQPFDLAAKLDADATRAAVESFTLKGPGMDATGKLTVDIPAQLAEGNIAIDASDLSPLGRLLGQPLGGALKADVTLAAKGKRQGVQAKATANDLTLQNISIAQAALDARTDDAATLAALRASLTASGIAAGNLTATALTAQLEGELTRGVTVTADGKGSLKDTPWVLALNGMASKPASDRYALDLAKLEGSYGDLPFALAAPAKLAHSPTQSTISPFRLQLAGGTVEAEGGITRTQVKGRLAIAGVALDNLPVEGLPEGALDATLTLAGTAAAPVMNWQAGGEFSFDGMPLTTAMDGSWQAGKLTTQAKLSSEQANAETVITLPAKLTLAPFATDISDATPLSGTVKTHLPLAMFNARLRAAGHRLQGTLGGEATLGGSLGAPDFSGGFALEDGRYDHSQTGICLRDMSARIAGSGKTIRLEQFRAVDSEQKTLTADASLSFGGTPSFGGEVKFDQFRLFCGGMMSGEIDGGLTIGGTTKAMNIAGGLQLGPLDIQLPGAQTGANIPQVETIWVGPESNAEESAPGIVGLDITLDAPQQLFIRGRGLDAEFGGKLHIGGTADTPKLDGKFSHRRGNFVLLDRVLELQTANILFEGPMPPSPFLNVIAETKVQDTTITVTMGGNAGSPTLKLSSTPSRPQDEVLALLLFGRQLETISPFEALQLAQAARQLAGLDSGPGLIGTIRDTLGLDRLQVGADEDANMNISTGKYVTDDVYVGVKQGAKPEDREIVTEITLTPSISGKTAVDSLGNQSVGVEWKRDY